jgi:NAD(P)-dependent dehydrogenase (short-subunit alcohol dehydrogenase family)
MSPRVWLITGCSSGLGRALATCVLERGEQVVVTARNPVDVRDLASRNSIAVALDITNPTQVKDAVETAERAFGRIDVLVNNAGYGYLAAVEEGEEHEVRAMFDANFFGLVDLIKRVLPAMRRRRSGHVVNISSMGGLVAGAATGYYNATKFALEGLSEALQKEVEPLGIRVTLIEPGPFRTDWAGRSLRQTGTPIEAYAGTAGARRATIVAGSGKQPGDPARAAAAIMAVADAPEPPFRLLLGRPALEMVRAKLAAMTQCIQRWEATTLEADFPQI